MVGCLFEIFFEILIEGVMELVMWIYLKLMFLIVPENELSKRTEEKIRNAVTTVSIVLLIVLFIGVVLWLGKMPPWETIGKYMTLIPLSIIGVQVLLGIALMVVKIVKKQRK